jgi:hypothetical protein
VRVQWVLVGLVGLSGFDVQAEGEAVPAAPETATAERATPAAAAPAPAAAAAPKAWYEALKLEGMVDGYYSYRFQGGVTDRVNELRAFDNQNHTFTVGYAKVALSMPAEPAGFRVDLGFGPTADLAATDLGTPEVFKHIQQAYASAKLFDKLTIDLGKFVTSAGAEVVEAKDNWLQSRSLLFGYAIPFTHTGLRLTLPVTDTLTLQGGVLNPWDTVLSGRTWKTFNASAFLNLPSGTSVAFNFYGGPQTTPDIRWLFDLVVNQNIGDRLALNLNGDFGLEGTAKWYGAALMGKFMLTDTIRLAGRVEYFSDPDGVRTAMLASQYITATVGMGFGFSGLAKVEIRPEIRHDQALGAVTPYVGGTSASQTSLQLAMVAWF